MLSVRRSHPNAPGLMWKVILRWERFPTWRRSRTGSESTRERNVVLSTSPYSFWCHRAIERTGIGKKCIVSMVICVSQPTRKGKGRPEL
ncbi:hypothetical protein ARMGADRAFT_735106 [Armillaria gallica]|uniref:Uncharacterized protein n=1 Tax=Armillaria gallica TaxID=47427 RepID=A0A2H3D200_ARMGA|nr:hypothetical protein ARMGADRAFT_735106 [Armillaria gallica]